MRGEFTLLQDVAMIMAVAGGALLLFHRFRQPAILGYLIAGVLVGPYTFRDFVIDDVDTIRLLADLGLVLLLFSIGLEFGWDRIRRLGLTIIAIGAIEITVMIALGYQLGRLLGWSGTDSLFLGAALSISSSAILLKVLRDSGQLHGPRGRLVVGVLVVEDFAAVILLTVLSGVATTGVASAGEIGRLFGKLVLFAGTAVAVSALFAPRIMDVVSRQGSRETLLVVALALCFGLALVAEELGISAAAGAFLIGAVLGDTRHTRDLASVMAPVRDMFAAIFFVSIGMLVDIGRIVDFIGPAIAATALFIAGKIVANTAAAFATGQDGETALQVGTAMPQPGEFSLAMVKVGADQGAVGPSLYPVVAATTAISTMVHPYIYRSAGALSRAMGRRMPPWLAGWIFTLRASAGALRLSLRFRSRPDVRDAGRQIGLNLVVIAVLLAAGPFVLRYADEIARAAPISERVLGLIVGVGVVVLCVPSGVAIWRALRTLADALALQIVRRRMPMVGEWRQDVARLVIRDSSVLLLIVLLGIWSLPLVTELLSLGGFAAPVPLALIAVALALAAGAIFRVHQVLVSTVTRTFLGDGPGQAKAKEHEAIEPSSPGAGQAGAAGKT